MPFCQVRMDGDRLVDLLGLPPTLTLPLPKPHHHPTTFIAVVGIEPRTLYSRSVLFHWDISSTSTAFLSGMKLSTTWYVRPSFSLPYPFICSPVQNTVAGSTQMRDLNLSHVFFQSVALLEQVDKHVLTPDFSLSHPLPRTNRVKWVLCTWCLIHIRYLKTN